MVGRGRAETGSPGSGVKVELTAATRKHRRPPTFQSCERRVFVGFGEGLEKRAGGNIETAPWADSSVRPSRKVPALNLFNARYVLYGWFTKSRWTAGPYPQWRVSIVRRRSPPRAFGPVSTARARAPLITAGPTTVFGWYAVCGTAGRGEGPWCGWGVRRAADRGRTDCRSDERHEAVTVAGTALLCPDSCIRLSRVPGVQDQAGGLARPG